MKLISSIVFSLVVAVFAVKSMKERHQEQFDQIELEEIRHQAKLNVRKRVAAMEVDRIQSLIPARENIVNIANSPAQMALAIEDLRESRAELRRYQSQLSR